MVFLREKNICVVVTSLGIYEPPAVQTNLSDFLDFFGIFIIISPKDDVYQDSKIFNFLQKNYSGRF